MRAKVQKSSCSCTEPSVSFTKKLKYSLTVEFLNRTEDSYTTPFSSKPSCFLSVFLTEGDVSERSACQI